MIARIWHGAVPLSNAEKYLALMNTIALPEYRSTQGNRGAWCLHRTESKTAYSDADVLGR